VPIENGITLGGLIQPHRVGDTIVCTVHRAGKTLMFNARLVERPSA